MLTLWAGTGNTAHTDTMTQELTGQPGLQGELDKSLGNTDFQRAGSSYGLARWIRGKGTSAKPHLIISSVKKELTPKTCPVTSVALTTTGTHVQAHIHT